MYPVIGPDVGKNLHIVVIPVGKKRAKGAVDKAAYERFVLGWLAFSFDVSSSGSANCNLDNLSRPLRPQTSLTLQVRECRLVQDFGSE
jgi:hypothetical protein